MDSTQRGVGGWIGRTVGLIGRVDIDDATVGAAESDDSGTTGGQGPCGGGGQHRSQQGSDGRKEQCEADRIGEEPRGQEQRCGEHEHRTVRQWARGIPATTDRAGDLGEGPPTLGAEQDRTEDRDGDQQGDRRQHAEHRAHAEDDHEFDDRHHEECDGEPAKHGLRVYRPRGVVDERPNLTPVERPPSVDRLARSLSDTGLPAPMLVEVARAAVETSRSTGGDATAIAADLATAGRRRLLTPVINGTGVLLHTNLGRAPLAVSVPSTATNLELDLDTGARGSRQAGLSDLVRAATGAEQAIVVNNCAGAVLLVLAALAAGRGVAVSRGELVEIGGGFRIPDVMRQSGARLVEVGTTNRTRLADYQGVLDDDLALIMKIHQSNYRIEGFTEAVPSADLAGHGVPLVVDLGSGLLDERCPWLDGPPPVWLRDEPGARQTLDRGADLVIFSGDKLLGGPQAGVIAGRADLVDACARHPLARALRPGVHVITAFTETLLTLLDGRGTDLPFWRMATVPTDELERRAHAIVAEVGAGVTVVETPSTPGGGTLPDVEIPSIGLLVRGDVREVLRSAERPVIARAAGDDTVVDLRTVHPDDDPLIVAALGATRAH